MMGAEAMLPKINALPSSQRKPSLFDGNRRVDASKRRPNMSRHIVRSLASVHEQSISIRTKPGKKSLQIVPHFRIRIFLNEQRRRGVLNMKSDKSQREFVQRQTTAHIAGDLIKSAPDGWDEQLFHRLFHNMREFRI